MHRLYLGKTFSGILYLFTFGLFGVGQLVDVFRIAQLVRDRNVMSLGERVLAAHSQALAYPASPVPVLAAPQDRDEQLRQLLLQAAARHGGRLSVTQGVAATGVAFAEVEAMLNDMVQSGYVGVDNDPDHGALVYVFGEL
jgi:TM2 domain-containing membrane protein YozV